MKNMRISSKTIYENKKLYIEYDLFKELPNSVTDEEIEDMIHPAVIKEIEDDYIDYEFCSVTRSLNIFNVRQLWGKYVAKMESMNLAPMGYKNFWKKLNTHKITCELDLDKKDEMYLTIVNPHTDIYVIILYHPFSDTVYIRVLQMEKFINTIQAISDIFHNIQYIPSGICYDKTLGISVTGQCTKLYTQMIEYYGLDIIKKSDEKFKEIVLDIKESLFIDLGNMKNLAASYEYNYNNKELKKIKLEYCREWSDKNVNDLFSPYIESAAAVGKDYHVKIENKRYSVPYEYYGKNLIKRVYSGKIAIYFYNELLVEYLRVDKNDKYDWYTTRPEDMPPNEKGLSGWNSEYFINRTKRYGAVIEKTMRHILNQCEIVEQSYQTCNAFLVFIGQHNSRIVAEICQELLDLNVKYISIKMLENGIAARNRKKEMMMTTY